MSQTFEGKVALVTGASRGIGAAISDTLASRGAVVFGTATSESGAASIDARLTAINNESQGRVLNVNDEDQVSALVKDITAETGAPVILVNNAGITRDNLLMRMKADEWDDVISTNLSGVYRLCKGCLRGMMKAKKGRIINIASVIGIMGNAGQSNYAAAKAGIIGFTKAVAFEYGAKGITCNAVSPGLAETDMLRDTGPVAAESMGISYEELKDQYAQDSAIKRLNTIDEVAAATLLLASEVGAGINGAILAVDGGTSL